MSTIFIIIFLFALWHFVYQGILLPNSRLSLRYRLFEIRDKLLSIELEHGKDEASLMIIDSINVSLKYMHSFNIYDLVSNINTINNDEKLKKSFLKRQEVIINSRKEIQEVISELVKINSTTLVFNAGGWLPFLILIFPIIYIKGLYSKFNSLISNISLIKEDELRLVMPSI